MTPAPRAWTFTEDGIRRQVALHMTHDDVEVAWAPRYPGDPAPWFDADRAGGDPAAYYEDADLVTLGVPVSSWSGFDD